MDTLISIFSRLFGIAVGIFFVKVGFQVVEHISIVEVAFGLVGLLGVFMAIACLASLANSFIKFFRHKFL